MTTACNTFFSLPELLAHLFPFLSRRQLIHLSQTNRTIYSICTPRLWREVKLASKRLHSSSVGLQAFHNNIDSVRSLTWKISFSWQYIYALWTHLKTTPSLSHQSIPTGALIHRKWGAMSASDLPVAITPLPPLLRLTSYDQDSERTFPTIYTKRIVTKHQHHLHWLLRLNRSTVTHVRIHEPPLLSDRLFRDFCRTISQLGHLRILSLNFPCRSTELTLQHFRVLFLSCPGSLVELSVKGWMYGTLKDVFLEPEDHDWDFPQGPLLLREEPLRDLRRLALPWVYDYGNYPAPFLCSIFKHCPALGKLSLPSFRDKTAIQDVATALGKYCPCISDLSLPIVCNTNGEILRRILEQIPGPRLEKIYVSELVESTPSALSTAAITRHSETLRQINFFTCQRLTGATLQPILMSCRALEVLKTQDEYSKNNTLLLEDAVVDKWACTKIQTLEIAVKFTPDGKNPKYLADPTMVTWTKQDHEHWGMLDKFYNQIGSLIELEALDIKSTGKQEEGMDGFVRETSFRRTCLPGLLALEDETTGQIGFLSRWAGLSKLRDLSGSFLWTTEEAEARMGDREVDWLVVSYNHVYIGDEEYIRTLRP